MNLDQCFQSLTASFAEWGDHLANRQCCVQGASVSWFGASDPRHSSVLGVTEFLKMVEQRQYTFQILDDGSLFRISYRYADRGRRIVAASLGFISAPQGLQFCAGLNEEGAHEESCNWVRIDFDSDNHRPPNHSCCHLHISGLPDARLPLTRLPTPRQFVSWIFSIFYPSAHGAYLESIEGREHEVNAPAFVDNYLGDIGAFIHVAVPPAAEAERR
jgi:hypothetical protein